ncbi:MAG TPA: DUF4279 domain-containing protein [Stellaceae bacterium]|nr:DUF4279 domain-containing protein [Stellaceae bacterium]
MRSSDALPETFVTLRFVGDELDPSHVSAILPVTPKRAHRKGEIFDAGARIGPLQGRTGVWYFDTRDLRSRDLLAHLRRIVKLLYPKPDDFDRVKRLQELLAREHARAEVSCFWYGKPGTDPPAIPQAIRDALKPLQADTIETEFHTAEPSFA